MVLEHGFDDLGFELRAFEIVAESSETTLVTVERGDLVTGRGELHRLAARCGAGVEHANRILRDQSRGE